MDETITKQIKIYCPQHQTVSEVEGKAQIICEIREHALSNNFPHSEYWEYCCDCQIFSPSSFGTGGKAVENCRHCERPTLRRFLCDECKIISYESDEETKGKNFTISPEGTKPACPGCRKLFGGVHSNQHQCADIEAALMTHRAECPFCRRSTFAKASSPKQVDRLPNNIEPTDVSPASTFSNTLSGAMPSTQCPKCGNWGFAGRIHCGKCGIQLNALAEGVSPGTATARTQLLGSICPNCGTGNQSGSAFCNSCGQALKTAQTPPAENAAQTVNLPPPIPNTQNTMPFGAQAIPPNDVQPKTSPIERNMTVLAIAGVALFVISILGIIAYNANKPGNENVKSPSPSPAKTSSPVNSAVIINRPAENTSSPSSVVGRKGRLTSNLNLRSAPNKVAEIRGTHYEGARIEVLSVESYTTQDEYVTWYKVRVLADGCDRVGGNGCGNNWERNGSFGWMEAETEGWMNSKYIALD